MTSLAHSRCRQLSSLCLLFIWLAPDLPAADLYVDNINGDDTNPGTPANPLRTFEKSLSVLAGGDTLHLVPHDEPYRERFGELGKKHSGTPEKPTVLDGHGAHLTRMNLFPAECWTRAGEDVFSLRYKHNIVVMSGKGYYDGFPFVFVDGKPLPWVKKREALTANSCFLFLYWDPAIGKLHPDHGMLYVKLEPGKTPADVKIMMPQPDGVIVGGDYITVKNINARWSSSDLFDTHRGKGIVFENIVASDCQDQCISAHSTAEGTVRYSFFRNALAMCVLDVTFTPTEDCRMNYNGCIFEQGGAGFKGGGHYVMENCIIRDNARNALSVRDRAALTVRNCTMVKGNDGRYGISIEGNARVELENCTFIGFDYGMALLGKNASVTLRNCVFLNCRETHFFWNGATPRQVTSENTVFSQAPVFTVEKQPITGLAALREKYPGAEPTSRELSPGEQATGGCAIPTTLTLPQLRDWIDGL